MENLRGGSPLSQISIPSTTIFVPPFPSIKVPLPSNVLNTNIVPPQEVMSTAHNSTTITLRCIAISFERERGEACTASSLAKRYHPCCNNAQPIVEEGRWFGRHGEGLKDLSRVVEELGGELGRDHVRFSRKFSCASGKPAAACKAIPLKVASDRQRCR